MCGAFAQRDIVLESGAHRVQDDSCGNHARQPNLPLTLGRSARSQFLRSLPVFHIEIEFALHRLDRPALPSMYAPIVLRAFVLIFVSISFPCKEP